MKSEKIKILDKGFDFIASQWRKECKS